LSSGPIPQWRRNLLELVGEVGDRRRAVELAPVGQTAVHAKIDAIGLVDVFSPFCHWPVVPGDRAVGGLGLDVRPSGVISTDVIRPSEPKPWATVSDCTSPS
jgi:hypothetical protein